MIKLISFLLLTLTQVSWAQEFEGLNPAAQNFYQAVQSQTTTASLENFLTKLPVEMKEKYVLVHDSGSLQSSSYENPRAILFNQDAKFIVSFNGDKAHRGYEAIESIAFNQDTKKFEFREIKFSENGAPELSEKNPEKCMSCHGKEYAPRWDHYKTWQGVYGEMDDSISQKEYTYLYNFMKSAETHPRYKVLKGLKQAFPFDEKIYQKAKTGNDPKSFVGVANRRLNKEFTFRLYYLNLQRIAEEISQKQEVLNEYQELHLYLLGQCYAPQYKVIGIIPTEDDFKKVFTSIAKNSEDKNQQYQSSSMVAYLHSVSGITTKHWYLNTERAKQKNAFTNGMIFPEGLLASLLLKKMDPLFSPLFEEVKMNGVPVAKIKPGVCETLQPKAQVQAQKLMDKASSQPENENISQEATKVPALCLSCHVGSDAQRRERAQGAFPPILPFEKLQKGEIISKEDKEFVKEVYEAITPSEGSDYRYMPPKALIKHDQLEDYLSEDYEDFKSYLESFLDNK